MDQLHVHGGIKGQLLESGKARLQKLLEIKMNVHSATCLNEDRLATIFAIHAHAFVSSIVCQMVEPGADNATEENETVMTWMVGTVAREQNKKRSVNGRN